MRAALLALVSVAVFACSSVEPLVDAGGGPDVSVGQDVGSSADAGAPGLDGGGPSGDVGSAADTAVDAAPVDAAPGPDGAGPVADALEVADAGSDATPLADAAVAADAAVDGSTGDATGDGGAADASDPQPVTPTIDGFQEVLGGGDAAALDAFLATWDGPVCDVDACLFVTVQPGVSTVELLGDFNGWVDGPLLAPVPFAPDVFWTTVTMTVTAVVEYKLKLDGAWDVDSSNRWFRFGPYGPNSAIYAPGTSRLGWLRGVASTELGNTRDLYVWVPAAYFDDPTLRLPVLYLQDGFNVFANPLAPYGTWNVEATADALIAQGLAEPVLLVGVDTAARLDEYTYDPIPLGDASSDPKLPAYATFLVGTVKPLVDATFRTRPEREATGMGGSSLGGISSLWTVWHHPDVFGRVASFSGSYWIGEEKGAEAATPLRELLVSTPGPTPATLRVYIDSGDTTFDGEVLYQADAWVYSDWTRNTLISLGWDNRSVWDTDADPTTTPEDLPIATAPGAVPSLPWASAPPAGQGWATWLGTSSNLLSMVGHGHMHNEASWEQRFGAALVFLYPGPGAQ